MFVGYGKRANYPMVSYGKRDDPNYGGVDMIPMITYDKREAADLFPGFNKRGPFGSGK